MDIKVLDPTGIYWTCNFCIEYWESLTIYLNKSKCLFWTRLVYINLWNFIGFFRVTENYWQDVRPGPHWCLLIWKSISECDLHLLNLELFHRAHQNVRARSHGSVLKIIFLVKIKIVIQNVWLGSDRSVLKKTIFSD